MSMEIAFGANARGFYAPPHVNVSDVLGAYRETVERRITSDLETGFVPGSSEIFSPEASLHNCLLAAEQKEEAWENLADTLWLSLELDGMYSGFKHPQMRELDFVRVFALKDSLEHGGTYFDFDTNIPFRDVNTEVAQAVGGALLPGAPLLCLRDALPVEIEEADPLKLMYQWYMNIWQTTVFAGDIRDFRGVFAKIRSAGSEDTPNLEMASMTRLWLDRVNHLVQLGTQLAESQGVNVSPLAHYADPMLLEEVDAVRDRFIFDRW